MMGGESGRGGYEVGAADGAADGGNAGLIDTGSMIVQGGVALQAKSLEGMQRELDAKAAAARDRPVNGWYLAKKKVIGE